MRSKGSQISKDGRAKHGRPNTSSSSSCNVRIILSFTITFFLGYLMGVNTTYTICSAVNQRRKEDSNANIRRKTENDNNSDNNNKVDCVSKLSTVIELLHMDDPSETNGKRITRLDDDERAMKKMVEDVVVRNATKLYDEEFEIRKKMMTETVVKRGTKVAKFAAGLARTDKKEFLTAFDYGFPDDWGDGNGHNEILLLYNENRYIPSDKITDDATNIDKHNNIPFIEDPLSATAKCDEVNVIVSQAPCLAISFTGKPGLGSHHVQRWSRRRHSTDRGKDYSNNTFAHVGRALGDSSYDEGEPPHRDQTERHWKRLNTYLSAYQESIKELKVITERIKINNTIIVMVCNFGQSELLMNFICSARSRSLDISNLLVFGTDIETLELAKSLGVEAYIDKKNFDNLPTAAAREYSDRIFTAMMYAKVVAVQLINFMGYDVLFQDVDMHWYKNPLVAFHNVSSKLNNFDIIFQDDGQRSRRYAPYFANSGFYYVRYNDRTRYLFVSLIVQGDFIIKTGSHQQLLSFLLNDHASWTGLRVKVLGFEEYPGGATYQRKPKAMRNIILSVDNRAEIFHMSWTNDKTDKLRYMKQMGMWHIHEECVGRSIGDFAKNDTKKQHAEQPLKMCCSVEPLITCHYRDTPSVVDCCSSPPKNEDSSCFWKDGMNKR